MTAKRYLRMTAGVFAVVALMHLARIVLGLPVTVGVQAIPMWISWIAVVGAGLLSFAGFRLSRRA
jgi:hypothetical protein